MNSLRRITWGALALLTLPLLPPAQAACSLSLTQPVAGPFPGVDIEGYLWLNQTLATIPFETAQGKNQGNLPLHAYWTTRLSAEDEPGPLGAGWFFPLLESYCRPAGPDKLTLYTPEGYTQTLFVERRLVQGREQFPRKISGSGWTGTQDSGKAIVINSDCGDRLRFDGKGNLTEILVDGSRFTLSRNGQGKTIELKSESATLCVFDYDPTGRLTRFKPAKSGWAVCEYAPIGILDQKNRWTEKTSLVKITFAEGGSFNFDFNKTAPSVTFPVQPEVKWNAESRFVQSVGTTKYNIIPHSNNPGGAEFILTASNGNTKLFYNDKTNGILIKSRADGTIEKTSFITTGPNKGMTRSVHLTVNGKEELHEKYEYDQQANCTYIFKNGDETRNKFDKLGNLIEISHENKKVIKEKSNDGSKRIIKLIDNIEYRRDIYLPKTGRGFELAWKFLNNHTPNNTPKSEIKEIAIAMDCENPSKTSTISIDILVFEKYKKIDNNKIITASAFREIENEIFTK